MIDLDLDAPALTAALVDVESVSGDEAQLCGQLEVALSTYEHLSLVRLGNALVARTSLGRDRRVILAGHLDTVPIAGNLPSRLADGVLHGCGTSDMKAGVAVMLRLAGQVTAPAYDLTFVFYDCEEVESARSGLGRIARERRDLLDGELALLLEPTDGQVEGGCQGTLRVEIAVTGRRAHSARSWLGTNAIHACAPILQALASHRPREVQIDGLTYREGLNAVGIRGGVAGNVVPDECIVTVNFRFAPDRSEEQALAYVRTLFGDVDLVLTDSAGGALPGLGVPAAAAFIDTVGAEPVAKYGWTDVARFAALGIPALNYGPGDPSLAHTREEHVAVSKIVGCEDVLRRWLGA